MTGRDKSITAESSSIFPCPSGTMPEWEMDALYEDLQDILTADSDGSGLFLKPSEPHQKDPDAYDSLQPSLIWPPYDDECPSKAIYNELSLVPGLDELLPSQIFELSNAEDQSGQQYSFVTSDYTTEYLSAPETVFREDQSRQQYSCVTLDHEKEYPSAPETDFKDDHSRQQYSCVTSGSEEEYPSAPESDSISSPSSQKMTDDDTANDRRSELKRKRRSQTQGGKKSRKEKEEENEKKVSELMVKNEQLQEEIKRLSEEVEATRKALIERMVSLRRM